MQNNPIKNIVIVGGGTAGWMTAAALSRYLPPKDYTIKLIESDQIGTIGVGEATIPGIRDFNNKLGIDENEFMRATKATYKLGIEFIDWTKKGHAYVHPFSYFGHDLNGVPFHNYWLKQKQLGDTTNISEYSIGYTAAKLNKFSHPTSDQKSVLSKFFYAFHLDATLYANYLRKFSSKAGVERIEGKVINVSTRKSDGFIEKLTLESGQTIQGDLFIDCSGFRGLLIEQTLKTGYQDWSHWLPCDRAIAVQTVSTEDAIPYTKATAREAGWQWKIPLQSRVGNGYVYSSQYISDEQAKQTLLSNIEGEMITEPKFIPFKAGKRNKLWNRNCVAIGLSSGFLEPLESTSIHLIQTSIMKLITHFPDQAFNPVDIQDYNNQMNRQFEQVKDFLILHYKTTQRDDSPFWKYCKSMAIPKELEHRINLFIETGHIVNCEKEVFVYSNWAAVLLGQELFPKVYHPRVDCINPEQLKILLAQMKLTIAKSVSTMPSHLETINRFCKA